MAAPAPDAGRACRRQGPPPPPRPPRLRCPSRLRRLALALGLALVPGAEGDGGGEPNWWRLRCNSTTTVQWRLCHVSFFADATCTRAPPAQLLQRVNSPGDTTYGVPVDAVFTEFASACQQCARGEAYLGVRFSVPVVVQCVRFSECWGGAPAPAPPPAPAPAGTTALEVATTTTMAAGQTTVSTVNNSAWDDLFNQIGGGFGGLPRRLGSASVGSLLLERSADGSDWRFVAEWLSPQPGASLSLATADQRPPPGPPQVVSWNPAAVNCNDCSRANVGGVEANHVLEVTFSEQIHWGHGNVVLERGGLGVVPLDPTLDARWFRVLGNRLRIMPPAEAPLGASSSCSKVTFDAQAIQNADGEYFEQGSPYTICIADSVAPTLMRTDPPDGSMNMGLLPRILLEFNEEVAVHMDPSPAQLVPIGSSTAEPMTISMADTSKVRITSCGYCALEGMVEIQLRTQLEPETTYELRVPSTSLSDTSGNAWSGSVLGFTTECPSTGCSTTAAPTAAPASSDAGDDEESHNIPLYLGIVGGVACCGVGLLVGWKYYVRHHLLPKRRGAKEETIPSAPTPAWTAKSGSTTIGWRKPQSTNGNAGLGVPGGPGSVNLNGSGSWGTSASRVTATTTPAGPRVAGEAGRSSAPGAPRAAAPQQQQQQPRASAPAGVLPKQPPSQPPVAPKARAQTDEDLKENSRSSHSAGASSFAGSGRKASFTEENATSGGWVRTVDPATGRTYWYHYKTRETRWDEPPRTGPPTPPRPKPRAAPEGEPPRAGAQAEAKAPGPQPKASPPSSPGGRQRSASGTDGASASAKPEARAPPPAAKAAAATPPPENTKAGRVKADVLEQLEKTKKEDIASRKKTFRFLCLQWHPDKNQEDAELATEVFQFMQLQRDWYLKE